MLMTALVNISDSQAAETDPPAVIEDLFAAPLATKWRKRFSTKMP